MCMYYFFFCLIGWFELFGSMWWCTMLTHVSLCCSLLFCDISIVAAHIMNEHTPCMYLLKKKEESRLHVPLLCFRAYTLRNNEDCCLRRNCQNSKQVWSAHFTFVWVKIKTHEISYYLLAAWICKSPVMGPYSEHFCSIPSLHSKGCSCRCLGF